MINCSKLEGTFALFSCVGFTLGFVGQRGEPTERYPMGEPIDELLAQFASHGAPEAWNQFAREPGRVWADIEHRGDDWHVDVITNALGAGRYDCWYAERCSNLTAALRTLQWLSRHNWQVLRSKRPEPNTARRLTTEERASLAAYVRCDYPYDTEG